MMRFQDLRYLMIEANSSCNLKCLSCTRETLVSEGFRPPKNLTESEFLFILDQLKECPLEVIKFEGLSEPMLHPYFDRLTFLLRKRFAQASVIVFTNLQYKASKVNLIQVLDTVDVLCLSIDGIGKTYEQLRQGAKFPRFIENLSFLKASCPPDALKKKVFLNFTACEANYRELPFIYSLQEAYGLAGVRINMAQNWDVTKTNDHPITMDMINSLKKYGGDVKGVGGWDYQDCFWPFHGTVIDVHGNVRQCVLSTTQKPLGNIFERPLKEILESSAELSQARRLLSENCPPDNCKTCDYKGLSSALSQIHGKKHFHKSFPKSAKATP